MPAPPRPQSRLWHVPAPLKGVRLAPVRVCGCVCARARLRALARACTCVWQLQPAVPPRGGVITPVRVLCTCFWQLQPAVPPRGGVITPVRVLCTCVWQLQPAVPPRGGVPGPDAAALPGPAGPGGGPAEPDGLEGRADVSGARHPRLTRDTANKRLIRDPPPPPKQRGTLV